MSNRNKVIKRSIFIAVIAGLVIGLGFFMVSGRPKTYNWAKEESLKILDKYQTEMEEIAKSSLKTQKSGEFKKYYYSYSILEDTVEFYIDGQGHLMTGGQDWYLVYTKDGTYEDQTETYFYEQAGGNNIIKAERIDEHWWYRWIDYDGTEKSNK